MSGEDICYLSAHEAMRLFKSRKLSPVELMQAVIARAEKVEPQINAFADTYFDEALAQARKAEAKFMKTGARVRPLEGLPCVIKDEIRLKGKRTTGGSLIYKDHVDDESDVIAERLQRAGAIFHARTTTPEFCLSGVTHSRIWGITRNPHNLAFTPGGSSGGTGASLAAGSTTLGTGTDIGGSIRIPAACCGVVGLKPTYGRVPEAPVFNLDFYSHSGPMTRNVTDCAMMFNVINGPSPKDIASLKPKMRVPEDPKGIKGWKVAYSIDLGYFEVDPEVRANTLRAVDMFRDLGCEVTEVDLGWTRDAEKACIDYSNKLFHQYVRRLLPEHRNIMTDYAVRVGEGAENSTADDFLRSYEVAYEMYLSLAPVLESHNILICPTNSVPAVQADHVPFDPDFTINGVPQDPEFGWIMTYPFNMLSRCPVMSMPSGNASNGVPTGIQIVGRTFDDKSVFRAAAAYETRSSFVRPDMGV